MTERNRAREVRQKFMKFPKVFLAAPIFKVTSRHTATALVQLTHQLTASGMWGGFGSLSHPDIAEIRDAFVTIWYDTISTEFMLFVDDDMDFDPALVFDMVKFNKPIVGAIYPKKTMPLAFVGHPMDKPPEAVEGFQQQTAVGGGVLLIRRDAISTIVNNVSGIVDQRLAKQSINQILAKFHVKRILRLFDKLDTPDGPLSEDYSFCKRATMAGLEIWANVSHHIVHVGEYGFGGRYVSVLKSKDAA